MCSACSSPDVEIHISVFLYKAGVKRPEFDFTTSVSNHDGLSETRNPKRDPGLIILISGLIMNLMMNRLVSQPQCVNLKLGLYFPCVVQSSVI